MSAKVMDHEYDGIREFDNPTPGWWHAIFMVSAVFAAFYFFYYHFSPISSSIHDKWRSRQVAEFQRIFGAIGELEGDEATILRMSGNPQMLAVAKGIFVGNCTACHASDGGGLSGSGVNLTDDHYKNVKQVADIFKTLSKGANNGAMPAWENRLLKNERVILAAYVASLRGTKPANPKSPEGEVIPPWPASPPPAAPGS